MKITLLAIASTICDQHGVVWKTEGSKFFALDCYVAPDSNKIAQEYKEIVSLDDLYDFLGY